MVGYDLDFSVQPPVENRRYLISLEKFKNINIHFLIRLILLAGTLYTIYLAIRIIEDFIKKMIEIIRNRNFWDLYWTHNNSIQTTQNYADLLNSDVGEQVGKVMIS